MFTLLHVQYLQRHTLSSDISSGNFRGCHIHTQSLKSAENLTLDSSFKRPWFQCSKSTVACGQNSKTRNITSWLQNYPGWCGQALRHERQKEARGNRNMVTSRHVNRSVTLKSQSSRNNSSLWERLKPHY